MVASRFPLPLPGVGRYEELPHNTCRNTTEVDTRGMCFVGVVGLPHGQSGRTSCLACSTIYSAPTFRIGLGPASSVNSTWAGMGSCFKAFKFLSICFPHLNSSESRGRTSQLAPIYRHEMLQILHQPKFKTYQIASNSSTEQ